MPNYARVVFDTGKQLGQGLGKALSRFQEGVDATYGQPGPKIEVTPFAPGSVTTGAVLAKLASSVLAAAREKANAAEALRRRDEQMAYQRARTADLTRRLNEPKYEYTTPQSQTKVHLPAYQLARIEQPQGSRASAERFPTRPDVAAGYRKIGREVPAEMNAAEDANAAKMLGIDRSKQTGRAFDAYTEQQRRAEQVSKDQQRQAFDDAIKEVWPTLSEIERLNWAYNKEGHPLVQSHAGVVKARERLLMTRAQNMLGGLSAAESFDDILSVLSGLSYNDELLPNYDEQNNMVPGATPLQLYMNDAIFHAREKAKALARTPTEKRRYEQLIHPLPPPK